MLYLFRLIGLAALVDFDVGVLERVEGEFFAIDEVSLQKLFKGRLGELSLEGHIACFFVMVDHQASSLLL